MDLLKIPKKRLEKYMTNQTHQGGVRKVSGYKINGKETTEEEYRAHRKQNNEQSKISRKKRDLEVLNMIKLIHTLETEKKDLETENKKKDYKYETLLDKFTELHKKHFIDQKYCTCCNGLING
jgi:hypothetical protein